MCPFRNYELQTPIKMPITSFVPRVLVIEDDPGIRSLLEEVLTSGGLKVRLETDGEFAVEAVRAFKPDVILLDIGLPGVHGMAVLDALQADDILCMVPVVMISAWRAESLIGRAFDNGAVDFLTKPFDMDELRASIYRVLKGERSPLLERHLDPPLEVPLAFSA